jgi:hypothetical protein
MLLRRHPALLREFIFVIVTQHVPTDFSDRTHFFQFLLQSDRMFHILVFVARLKDP